MARRLGSVAFRLALGYGVLVVATMAVISAALLFIGRYTAQNKTAAAAPNDISSKSIAVLPFDNLSGDPQNAYFSEGVQD